MGRTMGSKHMLVSNLPFYFPIDLGQIKNSVEVISIIDKCNSKKINVFNPPPIKPELQNYIEIVSPWPSNKY